MNVLLCLLFALATADSQSLVPELSSCSLAYALFEKFFMIQEAYSDKQTCIQIVTSASLQYVYLNQNNGMNTIRVRSILNHDVDLTILGSTISMKAPSGELDLKSLLKGTHDNGNGLRIETSPPDRYENAFVRIVTKEFSYTVSLNGTIAMFRSSHSPITAAVEETKKFAVIDRQYGKASAVSVSFHSKPDADLALLEVFLHREDAVEIRRELCTKIQQILAAVIALEIRDDCSLVLDVVPGLRAHNPKNPLLKIALGSDVTPVLSLAHERGHLHIPVHLARPYFRCEIVDSSDPSFPGGELKFAMNTEQCGDIQIVRQREADSNVRYKFSHEGLAYQIVKAGGIVTVRIAEMFVDFGFGELKIRTREERYEIRFARAPSGSRLKVEIRLR